MEKKLVKMEKILVKMEKVEKMEKILAILENYSYDTHSPCASTLRLACLQLAGAEWYACQPFYPPGS